MYMCRPTTGHVHLCNFSKKNENQQSSKPGREYWYGRPESLKDTETYRNSKKAVKPIKAPKKNIPKNPRGLPSMVANSAIAGKPLYGLHQGSKVQAELTI
jgi:hypothetical protein